MIKFISYLVIVTNYCAEPSSESSINIITPPEGAIIGQAYVPQCNVAVSDFLQANVMVQWINPMGVPLISRTATGNTSLPLMFSSLSASDAGNYTCRAIITPSLQNGQQMIEQVLNIEPTVDSGILLVYNY